VASPAVAVATAPLQYYDALLGGARDGPTEMLRRMYDVTGSPFDAVNTPLTTSVPAGTIISRWPALAALRSCQVVADTLKHYRYLRAGTKMRVRVNANRFTYGKLVLFWAPVPVTDPQFSWAGHPHVVFDVNSDEGGELEVFYFSQRPMVDLRQADDGTANGHFHLGVLNPLTAVSSTAVMSSLTCTAFLQFVDPVVDGPVL